MHSKIFQISKSPISEDEFIDESKYFDNFVGYIADYVDDLGANEDCYEWLGGTPGIEYHQSDKSITIVDKSAYFSGKYKEFKECLESLSKLSEETFSTSDFEFGMDMYRLKAAYNDEFAFYFDDDGEEFYMRTLDDFMREVSNGDKFYRGNVIDYHF